MGLILDRKATEGIYLSGPGVVKILRIRGNRVKLDIEAPDGTHIKRLEKLEEQPKDLTRKPEGG